MKKTKKDNKKPHASVASNLKIIFFYALILTVFICNAITAQPSSPNLQVPFSGTNSNTCYSAATLYDQVGS